MDKMIKPSTSQQGSFSTTIKQGASSGRENPPKVTKYLNPDLLPAAGLKKKR